MKREKINNVLSLSVEERYSFFVRKVADFEEVWGLYDDGWAMLSDSSGRKIIPFWPEKDFAQLCATEQWETYGARAIPLKDFIDKWLPGMKKDDILVGIFYTPSGKGIPVEPERLRADIEEELEQYE